MATSGVSLFNLSVDDIIDEAYARCGRIEGAISGKELISARISLNLLFQDWFNRGVNLWLVDQQTLALTSGIQDYDLDADTSDIFRDAVLRDVNNNDRVITRIQRDEWLAQPNKSSTGDPISWWLERGTENPVIHFWPVPDDSTHTFVYNRIRYMQDANDAKETPDLPRRFLPAIVAGLAYQVAMKTPTIAIDRRQELRADYQDCFKAALDEDRDRASTFLRPDFSWLYR